MNFQINFRKAVVITFLILLPLLSINMQRRAGDAPWYTKPFTWTFSAMHSSYSWFSDSVRSTTLLYVNLWDIKKNARQLTQENQKLKASLLRLQNLEAENSRLRELIGFRERINISMLAANVIGQDIISERDTIIINRGSNHNVKIGQAVISTNGVIGYILSTTPFTSQVLILTDRYAVVDAMVQRSRARGIVEGTNKEFCQLRHLERADDVRVGDLVVTSGLGHIFPKGLPIGIVSQVKKSQYGVSQEVDIKPIVSSRQLEEVFILKKTETSLSGGELERELKKEALQDSPKSEPKPI